VSKTKTKQPWLKFNPQDWRGDARLRICSIGARGLWVEMICIMHEGEPYGHLLVSDRPPTTKQLAALAGISNAECEKFLTELELAGVYSKTEEGVIYSRRMVRDKAKAEKDRENGKGGGNPQLLDSVNGGVNPPDIPEDKAKNPQSRIQRKDLSRSVADATRPSAHSRFDEFWKCYPRRDGPNPSKPAEAKFNALVKTGVDPQMLIDEVKKFAAAEKSRGSVGTRFIPQATKWLNEQRWADHAAVAALQAIGDPPQLDWEKIVGFYARNGFWSRHAGPEPGLTGCRAPPELLAKHGLGPNGRKLPPSAPQAP
jgi:hypothetical protein